MKREPRRASYGFKIATVHYRHGTFHLSGWCGVCPLPRPGLRHRTAIGVLCSYDFASTSRSR
eukprot:6603334-Prymnesium_polylepis.1